eukprot:CAMPEP_0202708182 /NCGR_PEP_ID=MMETSP1385-20130828/20435_1 /ASSEMBLY_ACC=CAM_ASM_000861 /TAXON_ID=933848 /ORGANISM="Elphidium margaritaceum" /LENGTH=341 /DNA_ID=CAMNT_0049367095 /DNA_START=36 /DNA_END=1058 /DNA_ORIENTATION=-
MSKIKSDELKEMQPVDSKNFCRAMRLRGFQPKAVAVLANTLQGVVWDATVLNPAKKNDNDRVVVKMTNRYLHENGIAATKNKILTVKENIVLEASIMKYLSTFKDLPKSIVRFHDFFQSNRNFYLVEEHGGMPLFDFVVQCHQLIASGCIQLDDWKRAVRVIFKQMLECIEFIHAKNVVHFDLSLENFLINDVAMDVRQEENKSSERVRFILDDIQIKLCDFGLAERFAGDQCLSNKHCGKSNYKSPEISHAKPVFDAKKNDIWCLGVSLFMMCIGAGPFTVAHESDELYCLTVVQGKFADVLQAWNKSDYADKALLDMFARLFQPEANRISLTEIKNHNW